MFQSFINVLGNFLGTRYPMAGVLNDERPNIGPVVNSYLLLEDGTPSYLLLEDGVSRLILNG